MKTPCEDSPFAYRPGLCTSKSRCTLGDVPITQEIRANKAWGSGAESPGGNPYGPDRELFLCFLLFGPVAPIGRAPDLHSGCCGFESHPVHKIT